MKNELRKVYFCEFCNKHNLSAASTSRHEKYCRYNPRNKHKCFELCTYLKRERKFDGFKLKTTFTCVKKKDKMYSYQAEKKMTSYFTHPDMIKGLKRMPLECDLYRKMTFDEQEKRFGTLDYSEDNY